MFAAVTTSLSALLASESKEHSESPVSESEVKSAVAISSSLASYAFVAGELSVSPSGTAQAEVALSAISTELAAAYPSVLTPVVCQ